MNHQKKFTTSRVWLGVSCLVAANLFWSTMHMAEARSNSKPAQRIKAVALLQAPPIQPEQLRERNAQRKSVSPEKILHFAEPYEAHAKHTHHGLWQEIDNGRMRWTLLVHAPGATDVNLGLVDVNLPETARLRVTTADGLFYAGPYDDTDVSQSGDLWTPILPGDFVVIEAEMASDVYEDFSLTVFRVNSGYLDILDWLSDATKDAQKAQGWCNIDVVCPATSGWGNPIRSVGRYSIMGTGLCSGTLIMNQRADFRPFFLTANHCVSTSSEANSVVVYWNYQSPTCGALSGGSLGQFQSGASLRATYQPTDFTLLELNAQPSSAFNVHYAGWDRSGVAFAGAVGIHHPRGREKAWSYSSGTLQSTAYLRRTQNASANYWRVVQWTSGTTEPGSSGSGLWRSSTQRLVGQLHGGYAACGNNLDDWYGKLSTSWTGGGTSSSRLRDWLDPDNVGVTAMNGQDPSSGTGPGTPGLLSPSNSATVNGTSVLFSWTVPSGSPTRYHLQVSRFASFSSTVYNNDNVTSSSITLTGFPNDGTVYYWRVRAQNSGGWGSWSPIRNFTNGGSGSPLGDAVDAPGLPWTTGGNANWFRQTSVTRDGVDAAQSGSITHNQESWIQTTVTGPGVISFWWNVSSEANYDWLYFFISGTWRRRISGAFDWERRSYTVPSGAQTLRWSYIKDGSITRGTDAGWLDQVRWTPDQEGAVYRFWSPHFNGHFYTISTAERNQIISNSQDIWNFEGAAWFAHTSAVSGSSPVYRFWSPVYRRHFFTISLAERNNIIANWPSIWTYEGVAWHAYASPGTGRSPVYRFWSPVNRAHFFTISLAERNSIIANWPNVWSYEGVAYYALTSAP